MLNFFWFCALVCTTHCAQKYCLIDEDKYYETKKYDPTLDDLVEIMNIYTWRDSYKRSVFDCSEMSAYIEFKLESFGFETYIVSGKTPFNTSTYHAWILVSFGDKIIPIEATSFRIIDENHDNYNAYLSDYDNIYSTICDAIDEMPDEYDWWKTFPIDKAGFTIDAILDFSVYKKNKIWLAQNTEYDMQKFHSKVLDIVSKYSDSSRIVNTITRTFLKGFVRGLKNK